MAEPTPRPIQVTIAGWLVVGGSVAVVLAAFDQISGLHTLETREAVQEALSKPPADGLGIGIEGALSGIRVMSMIAAACATAAGILGVQVLLRSKQARLALTILAAPLFLTGVVLGGIVPAIVVGAITMLWVQPSRAWLDGKEPPTPKALARQRSSAPAGAPTIGRPSPDAPTSPDWAAEVRVPPGPSVGVEAPRRPVALMWACALTWFGSLTASMLMLASLGAVLIAPGILDQVFEQNPDLDRASISTGLIQGTIAVMTAVAVAWSAAASVFAWFAMRGRSWAWMALLISACIAAAACLALALGSPFMLLPTALCAATVPLLIRPQVRAYVARR